MQWKGREESGNVEDRRGMSPGKMAVGGGAGGILLLLVVLFLGGDPAVVLKEVQKQQRPPADAAAKAPTNPKEEERVRFVRVVLKDTEDVWNDLFRRMGKRYEEPRLVLFRDQVDSACGLADAAVGPFYCPADRRVYIDLSFFEELAERFQAPGEFAQAYVIAHEIGHHVQNLLGTSSRVHAQQQGLSKTEANRLSVRLELQADFYAGVWAHHAQKTKKILEPGDLESALRAATAIGDDRLQKQARGRVVPDSFTHGTSAQRVRWFRRGFESGDLNQGDTFRIPYEDL